MQVLPPCTRQSMRTSTGLRQQVRMPWASSTIPATARRPAIERCAGRRRSGTYKRRRGTVAMAFSRDEILKAWDETVGELAREHDNPTDEEIVAATAAVCGKLSQRNAGRY